MRLLFVALLFVMSLALSAQLTPNQILNLGFEKVDEKGRITGCNYSTGFNAYLGQKDDLVKIEGNNSLRLQKNDSSNKGGFGVFSFSLPASFKGTTVTLKGFIRTEGVESGYAGLWLRADAGSRMITLENMKENGVTGTEDWKQYSISVPMDEEISSFVFGGLLTGKGKSWFDKLELFVDEKPVQTVAWLPGKTWRKELTASGVRIDSILTKQQTENIFVLAKVWGFLKYHHPDVAKGNYDFDSCLFSVLPAVLYAADNEQRDKALVNWINALGDEKKYPIAGDPENKDIHSRPGLDWMNANPILGSGLSSALNSIYLHRNQGKNYYVRMAPGVGNPLFDKEAVYRSVPSEDDGMRMLALIRYWNMIEYFFPYKHLLTENWNDVLKEFIPVFAANRSAINYRLSCLRLINRVHDTHANIYNDQLLSKYFGNKISALDFKKVEKKLVVTNFLNDSLAAFEKLKPGDEITEVNGKTISELRQQAEPYLCASNESVAERNFIDRFLFNSNSDSILVKYKRNNRFSTYFLRLYPRDKMPYRNGDNWRMPMYVLLTPDIGYINLGKIKADSLPVIFKSFDHTKGLIIDIRNYPNEFMPFAMGKYLKNAASPFVKFTAGDLMNPGLFRFTPTISNGPSDKNDSSFYKGYVIILVNEQSQSQAEYTTMALQTAPNALVMGSQTAGADGNISYVPFPGGFSSPFSGIGVFYPDGKETQGIGIVPHVVVKPTQKGIAAGRDEVLEKAKEKIQEKKGF